MATCNELLDAAAAKLKEYEAFIEEIMSGPRVVASVLGPTPDPDTWVVNAMGSVTTAKRPPKAKYKPKVGDTCWVAQGMILDEVEVPAVGTYVSVAASPKDGFVEVNAFGALRRVFVGRLAKLEVGDQNLLDPSGFVGIHKQPPKEEPSRRPARPVTWTDVGGLEDAKDALRDAVEVPYKHPEIFAGYDTRPPKGILLLGPPGCGKTLLGKATASSLSSTHKTGADSGFIYIKGPEVLSKWVGEAEANIRELFNQARKHKKLHGFEAVIFIDEADALLGARGKGLGSIADTVVPAFLAEMDGMEEAAAVVLLATNRPHLLDSAVTRDGRVDRKIRVGRPDRRTAREILTIHAAGGGAGSVSREVLDQTVDLLWSDQFPLLHARTPEGTITGYVRDTVSGAMIHGIVKRAKATAIRRDITNKAKKATGIQWDDLKNAILATWHETRHTRLDEVAQELCEARGTMLQGFQAITN